MPGAAQGVLLMGVLGIGIAQSLQVDTIFVNSAATAYRGSLAQDYQQHGYTFVLGDLNDFEFSKTADILVGSGSTALTDLPRTLPANERYTYVYQGNSQVLDHILLSPNLVRTMANKKYSYDIVHTNSEFSDQDSDHEPQVVRLPVQVTR